jgi:hypothetical protein
MLPGSQLRLVLGFAAAGLLSLGAIVVLPSGDGATPPAGTLVAVASLVAIVSGIALYFGLRWELRLPLATVLFAFGYNALVVVVKFVIGPQALYDASESGKVHANLGNQGMATVTAVGIGAVYLFVFWLLYRLARRQLEDKPRERSYRWMLVVVVGVVLFVSGLLPVLLLVFALVGGEYVSFIFGSAAAFVAGAALAGALSLALLTLTTTAERARAVGDATLLVSVFWVGAAYLALYHALWVVYVLVLTSIWPLKVVTSK